MKRLVRVGCELVMERSQSYTRDLYPCYEIFSKYYPEHKTNMYHVLELALNPTNKANEVIAVLENFGQWLVQEINELNKK